MKKKNFRIVSRSNLSVTCYDIQLAIVSPILIPIALVGLLTNFIIDGWGKYKDWYLEKTLRS